MPKEYEGIGGEAFRFEDEGDNSVSVDNLEFWKWCLLISFHIIFAIMGYIGQVMIIWYIRWYAPKQRPINRMISVDMVCSRSCNGIKQIFRFRSRPVF